MPGRIRTDDLVHRGQSLLLIGIEFEGRIRQDLALSPRLAADKFLFDGHERSVHQRRETRAAEVRHEAQFLQ